MARLYEPDGTLNGIFTVSFCIQYCAAHPGWYWAYGDDTYGET